MLLSMSGCLQSSCFQDGCLQSGCLRSNNVIIDEINRFDKFRVRFWVRDGIWFRVRNRVGLKC